MYLFRFQLCLALANLSSDGLFIKLLHSCCVEALSSDLLQDGFGAFGGCVCFWMVSGDWLGLESTCEVLYRAQIHLVGFHQFLPNLYSRMKST